MKLVADWLGFWIDYEVDVTRAQAATAARESKGKPGRQFEAIDQHVTAFRKKLFDALFRGGVVGHVRKVGQRALPKNSSSASAFVVATLIRTARFNQRRKRRQQAFHILERYDHGRGLAGKDVIRKTRRDDQITKRRARRHPA